MGNKNIYLNKPQQLNINFEKNENSNQHLINSNIFFVLFN